MRKGPPIKVVSILLNESNGTAQLHNETIKHNRTVILATQRIF